MHKAMSFIIVLALAVGMMYAVDAFILGKGKEFNVMDTIVRIVVVLVAVGLAGALYSKVSHQAPAPKVSL